MKSFIAFHPISAALIFTGALSFLILRIGRNRIANPALAADSVARKRFGAAPKIPTPILLSTAATGVVGFLIALLIAGSAVIAMPIALFSSVVPLFNAKRKREKSRLALQELWPEILDQLISGLQSGLSLAQTLASLSQRGPLPSRLVFLRFRENLTATGDFETSLISVQEFFADSIADQVCEVLLFAKSSGSRDTALTLRTLADFVRSDLALRAEISAKHSWIKNSALLAAIAPWLLLLLLAAQPATARAYTSPSGVIVLMAGVAMTFVAYIWMARVGRLRENARIFSHSTLPSLKELEGHDQVSTLSGVAS